MYYIGTKAECEAYDSIVTSGENYQAPTTNWANIIQHPTEDKCAILKHDNYSTPMTEVETLTEDWYNLEIV